MIESNEFIERLQRFPKHINGIVVPEHIRRSAAWWGLYNSLATVAPNEHGYLLTPKFGYLLATRVSDCLGIRKFTSEGTAAHAVPILGGEETIIRYFSEGPLLDSWMGEQ